MKFCRDGRGPALLTSISHTSLSTLSQEPVRLLALALAVSFVMFAPYLLATDPGRILYGDNAILCFPQFVDGYYLAKRGVLTGIDFLTNNGASAYFLRPNLPIYQPLYYLVYLLGNFSTTAQLAFAYVFVWYLHGVIAVYFAARTARRHFDLGIGASVLLAVLYFGGIARFASAMPVFYYPAAFFPWLLYTVIQAGRTPATWWRVVLHSAPFVAMFLSGYLPVGVNAVAVAVGFSLFVAWIRPGDIQFNVQAKRMLAPFALGSLVVLPLYIALLRYHELVPGLPTGAWQAAHHLAYTASEILGLVSTAFQAGPAPVAGWPAGEWPHLNVGLVSIVVLALAFTQRHRFTLSKFQADVIAASSIVFCFYLLLGFGGSNGLADIFYYLVPALGEMHVYGRYAIVASFFFCLIVAMVMEPLVSVRTSLPVSRWAFGLVGAAIAVQGVVTYLAVEYTEMIRPDILAMELLLCAVALLGFASRRAGQAFFGVLAIAFLLAVPNAYSPVNQVSSANPSAYSEDLSNRLEHEANLHSWLRANSSKTLIKILDASPGVEKVKGMGTNYPWMAQRTMMLSNYMGYEQGTSVDRDYAKVFPYWGTVDFPWALRTGADFIVYQVGMPKYATELNDWIDPSVVQFELGDGFRVAKLHDAAGNLPYVPSRRAGDFDNGIVRVFNAAGTAAVTKFRTNYASRVSFEVASPLPANVLFQLFPSKLMQLRVDGVAVPQASAAAPATVELAPGKHLVEYVYSNPVHSLFGVLYPLYVLVVFGILAWLGWRGWRARRVGRSRNPTLAQTTLEIPKLPGGPLPG